MLIEASCCNLLSSSSFLLFFFPLLRSICFASTRRFLVYPPIFLVPSLYSFIVFVFSMLANLFGATSKTTTLSKTRLCDELWLVEECPHMNLSSLFPPTTTHHMGELWAKLWFWVWY